MGFLFGLLPLFILILLIYYGFSKYKLHFNQEVVIPKKIVALLLLIILGFNLFLFEANPGIGWSLFFTMLFVFFLTMFPQEKRNFFVYLLTSTGIISGIALAGRANDFMVETNLSILFFSIIFLLILYSVEDAAKHIFAFIRGGWALFFGFFRQIGNLFSFAQKNSDKNRLNILRVLKTSAITVLVIVIFVSLLSKADPVFAQIIEDFFGNIEKRFIFSLVLIALATLGCTISINAQKPINTKLSFLNYYDFIIPLSVLTTLLAVFLAIQFTYLFGGQADLSAFDLTFSEYVRKGFIELLIATFFGILISVIILLKQDHLKAKENKILKLVHFVLLLELFLMLVSAFKRDIIYIDSYGLTRIRIIGGMFLVWLAALFVIIIAANFTKKISKQTILISSVSLGFVLFVILNTVNLDQLIVDYNAKHFPEKQDIFYNSLLSADAVKGWEEGIVTSQKIYNQFAEKPTLTEDEKKIFAGALLAVKAITEKRDNLLNHYGTIEEMKDNDYADLPRGFPDKIRYNRKWQALNFGEKHAFEYMKKNSSVFEGTLACLNKNIDLYQIKNSINLNDQTNERLHEYEYPLIQRFYYYKELHSIKRSIFAYFLETYYGDERDGKYYRDFDFDYAEDLKPILDELKTKLSINPTDLNDYQKRDAYYKEFEEHLIKLVRVEKCE